MARGRRPQPSAIKSQKEPVRSKRMRPSASRASSSPDRAGNAPTWLKAEGLKVWHRLAPTLRGAKLLTEADSATFARYCRNFARWLKLQAVLDKEGETYETETYLNGEDGAARSSNKLKRAHPAFMIADRLERQLLAAEDRFGLNPVERQRIMAARAQTGVSGDLFSPPSPSPRNDDPAAKPTAPAEPIESPVGLLN